MSEVADNSETFHITISGTRPLLMHSPAAMAKPKSKKIKSSEHDLEQDAKDALYLNGEGEICVPSRSILASMRKAAGNLKKAGAGKKTLKDFVYSGLVINEDLIPLPDQEYTVDVQPVVVQRARIMRARPLFKNWDLSFTLTCIDLHTWDAGNIREVLEEAGKYQGLLDFRPLYGTFAVKSMTTASGKEVK